MAIAEETQGLQGLEALNRAVESCEVGNELANDPQMLADFLLEAGEHLTNIEEYMLRLEQAPEDREVLNGAFRSFHSLKGLAGFLDFRVIQQVSHEVESLLDRARNGELRLTPAVIDAILHAADYLGQWVHFLDARRGNRALAEPANHEQVVARIVAAGSAEAAAAGQEPPSPAEPDAGCTGAGGPASAPRNTPDQNANAATVKVSAEKLGYMVDMVGELVIAQTMIHHNSDLDVAKTPRVQRDLAQLARVTAEVQKTAMALRMVEIGHLFRRMTRLVRDLSRNSGKRAELELFGEDVELDRTIVDELGDPLVHLLRNCIDHGLETPEQRAAAGKPPVGRVVLRASHQAGQIIIEVADDGRGLDREAILRKGIERGLVAAEAALSDSEVYELIFQPGFSTAEKVSDVSGRGVGMDVVRRQLEKLRGRIDIETRPGLGTRFLLRLPLTLAIIHGLIVLVGKERYILPIYAVREVFRPAEDSVFTVEGRGEMAMVRQRLLPVMRLANKLGVEGKAHHPSEGLLIVGESGGKEFCLMVDELAGKQEVVIKSLGPAFEGVRGVAGGAILGDGRVGLILELSALLGIVDHGAIAV